jgi:exodeoxyribonuclease V beta subunit
MSSRLNNCENLEELPKECVIPVPPHAEYTPPPITAELKAQEMPKIPGPCITTSFSSMAPGHSGQLYLPPDPDDKEDDEDDSTEDGLPPPEKQTDPLRRLKGKNFGLLLHGIMETVDFTASDDIITEAVKRDILLTEPTEEEIKYSAQVISNTLKLQLPGGPRISEISKEKRLPEMRFHFRFNSNLNKGAIRTAAAEHLAEVHEEKKDDHITYHGGFLTGSIDLLFEHDGKYYVLDWKSNLLPEYSPAMLKQSIIHSYYQMQYLIYLAAVIRLLKQRLNLSEEEAYEKIGGVYYVYMRGVDSEHPENGVFFDRPEYSEITKITGLLK